MQHDPPSDAELVGRTLAGDRQAFASLYDRHAPLVRAVAWCASRDCNGVGDLAQETFLRAFRNLDRLREPERFAAWIAGIARQVARERRRSLRRDRLEVVGEKLAVEPAGCDDDPVAAADELEMVLRKLVTLDVREQLAIHLYFLQGRDANEIARQLGLSRSGAYAMVARALARLSELVLSRQPNRETK